MKDRGALEGLDDAVDAAAKNKPLEDAGFGVDQSMFRNADRGIVLELADAVPGSTGVVKKGESEPRRHEGVSTLV